MMDSPFLSFGRIRHCKTKFGFGEKDQKGWKVYLSKTLILEKVDKTK